MKDNLLKINFNSDLWALAKDFKYLILILLVIISAIIASKFVLRFLKRYFEKSDKFGDVDQTNYSFFRNTVNFTFFTIALVIIFYSIPALHSIGVTLFAGAGIFAAIVGFASQQAFSNIIGGIFIVIFKPFRLHDILKVGNLEWGTVEDITLRHTVIKSFENRRYVIPNSVISSETLLNASIVDEKVCVFVEISISYDSDVDTAIKIMQEEAQQHPYFVDNRSEEDKENKIPSVIVRLTKFNDSSITLRANVWVDNPIDAFALKTDLFLSIKKRFDSDKIELPYPYRTIVYKKDQQNQ